MAAVISIIGRSYCGSTVLNLMLSAHPKVFGGGELHRLGIPDRAPVCPVCGRKCAFWTPKFIESQRARFDYGAIADRAGCGVVVDASKTTAWFESIAAARAGHELVDVALCKHPMRHISSFVDNQYYRDAGVYARINEAGGDLSQVDLDVDALKAYAIKIAGSLNENYRRAGEAFAPATDAPTLLRYEDLVKDSRGALSPILARAGLAYDPAIAAYERRSHHGLGGNSGAYSVVRRAMDPAAQEKRDARQVSAARVSVFRRDYYEGVGRLARDDKYLRVLPEAVREDLKRADAYRDLCDRLGYDVDPAA